MPTIYEDLGAQKNFAWFYESFKTKYKVLSLVVIVVGRAFCFKNHKNYNSLLKLSYGYFLLFIFISLVRASSGDSGILIYWHKDSFIG